MKKYDTTTRITYVNFDWLKIKSGCMTTISKQAGDKEPSREWKRKLLICQHSPLRRGEISWKWETIPYCISTHFCRHHEGCEKFVSSSRSDRTEIKDRSQRTQMDPVMMEMDANIQALINLASKRLCLCADATTIEYMKALVEEIRKIDEDVAWALVPQCVRCGGCVEPFSECHFYENLMKDVSLEDQMDVTKRYDIYNEKVMTLRKKENTHGR